MYKVFERNGTFEDDQVNAEYMSNAIRSHFFVRYAVHKTSIEQKLHALTMSRQVQS